MDFHCLPRRDLQFLCKRNKIPANMTNLAMADALTALEFVEGLNEYMNQSDSNAPKYPTSVAKQPPNTATRTTRRKTAINAEPRSSSQLMTSSCHFTSKYLAGEMDQDPKTNNVKFETSVAKTPAARSKAVTSCISKVQESKKGETVQSVYSTRRSTRLLEKCMADLSLKTKETLDEPAEKEDAEQKVSAQEKNPVDSEAEVILGRDLGASMEKEWEMLNNDLGDLSNITVCDTNSETNMETTNEVIGDEKESKNSLIQVENQEETLQANKAICKKNDNDQEIYVDLGDVPVLEYANTETNNGSKKDSEQETEHGTQENDCEPKEANNFKEDTVVDQIDSDVGDSETEQEEDNSGVDLGDTISGFKNDSEEETEDATQENDCEPVEANNFKEDTMVDQTDTDAGDSETEQEEDNSGDGTISEADSNQAVMRADEEMVLSESEGSATAPTSPLLEEAKVKTTPLSPCAAESISVQFPRPNKSTTPLKNSALKLKLINVDNNNKENNMEMMMNVVNNNKESKGEEAQKKKKKVEIDEEILKDMSMRQLEKMVKELSIKSSNRTALQILPGNNQNLE